MDGADEFDPQLRLIKGGGGALLREKIVASATKQLVIVADASKQVPMLGRFPLPVEVIPFAQALVKKRIAVLGADVTLRMDGDGKPYVTDEHNHILDCRIDPIPDPPRPDSQRGCAGPAIERHARRGRARIVHRNGQRGAGCKGKRDCRIAAFLRA